MSQPKVNVNNLNLSQIPAEGSDKIVMFVYQGEAQHANLDQVISINSQSDLKEVISENDTVAYRSVYAAQIAGGQSWNAYALGLTDIDDADLLDTLKDYMKLYQPEGMCLMGMTLDWDAANEISGVIADVQAMFVGLHNSDAIDAFCILELPDKPVADTWAEFTVKATTELDGLVAANILAVPAFHKTNAGVLAGRLCSPLASIADSPRRTKTGSILGLELPQVGLDGAALETLSNIRLGVPNTFANYDGQYWGNGRTLDGATGDFQEIEYLRPLWKAAKKVRALGIASIGDRTFNNSSESIEAHKNLFKKPLKDMSKPMPDVGEIRPPKSDAVDIIWDGLKKANVYLKVQPWNSAEVITFNFSLDLSTD